MSVSLFCRSVPDKHSPENSKMYTDHSSQSKPWGSSKHPPPLKPLPPLPDEAYLISPGPIAAESLLLHPVPSPFLCIEMMTLPCEQQSYTSQPQSIMSSSQSYRDSATSIIEFAQSLLPPSPTSIRPVTPANSVDCRLQQNQDRSSETLSMSPISKRSATPQQLNKLCSEMESLKLKRHDSARFDTTQPSHLAAKTMHADNAVFQTNSYAPRHVALGSEQRVRSEPEAICQPLCSMPLPQIQVPQPGQTSFIDWDDEVPRFVKVKRSIADLKNVTRARSNSSPLIPAGSPVPSASTASSLRLDNYPPFITEGTIFRQQSARKTSRTSSCNESARQIKRKSLRSQRTITMTGTPNRHSRLQPYRTTSATSTQTVLSSRRERFITVDSEIGTRRSSSLNKFTCWMKKVIRHR